MNLENTESFIEQGRECVLVHFYRKHADSPAAHGYYVAELFYNDKPFLEGSPVPETGGELEIPQIVVRGIKDDDDPDIRQSEIDTRKAEEEAAHRDVFYHTKDLLRQLGYHRFAFVDEGIGEVEPTHGSVIFGTPWGQNAAPRVTAALALGRKFTGIDIDRKAIGMTRHRSRPD